MSMRRVGIEKRDLIPRTESSHLAPNDTSRERTNSDGQVDRNGNMTWIVIGGVAGVGFLLVVLVVVIWNRYWSKHRHSFERFTDEISDDVSKSAPISRKSSPVMEKRKAGSDAYGSVNTSMVRSATMSSIPDFTLPPERVQPMSPDSKEASATAHQYQNTFLGTLQPSLYRSDGLCSEDEYNLTPSSYGRLWFSVVYDVAVEQLSATLVKVKDLPARNRRDNGLRDPFVKVFLLPDERTCRMSKVRKKTINPVYNETFFFQVPGDDVANRNLRFSVYDVDRRRVRHSLGHIVVPLQEALQNDGAVQWRDLVLSAQNTLSVGEMNLGLTYLPHMDKMKIVILRIRNIKHLDFGSDIGLYVKLHFYYGRKSVKTKKTMTKRMGQETNFNESFSFNTAGKYIDSCNFIMSLMQLSRGALAHDQEIGHVTLGSFMYARGEGLLHWQDMVVQARTTVSRWHCLTPARSAHS